MRLCSTFTCAKKSYCNVNRHDIVLEILKILSTLDPSLGNAPRCWQKGASGFRKGANTLAKSEEALEKNAKKIGYAGS